jgi:hypothetical protein
VYPIGFGYGEMLLLWVKYCEKRNKRLAIKYLIFVRDGDETE